MSPTIKSTGVGHFGAKFGDEEVGPVDRCKPDFKTIGKRHRAVIEIVSISSSV